MARSAAARNEFRIVNPVIAKVIGARLGEMAKRLRASSRAHVENRIPCQNRGMYHVSGCLTVRFAARGSVREIVVEALMRSFFVCETARRPPTANSSRRLAVMP